MGAHTYLPTPKLRQVTNASARIAALTPRRRDVLNGILAGYSNKMIAHSLGISPRTVEVHRARMMRDLGARHIADVIRLACEAMDFLQRAQHDTPGAAGQRASSKPFVRPTRR